MLVALLETLTCVGAFFLFMSSKGFGLSSLLYNRSFWESATGPTLAAYRGGVSAYFLTLVLCQASAHIFSVKTSRTSIFSGGFNAFSNKMTNLGVLAAWAVAMLAIYPLQGSVCVGSSRL